jgi:hypothetical protein
MKSKLLVAYFMALPFMIFGQTPVTIIGSWVKTKVEAFDKTMTSTLMERNLSFLKYTFENNGKAYFSVTPTEKGFENKYKIKKDVIEFGFNKMKIEQIDAANLVLVELDGDAVTKKSVRFHFIREQAYLDKIPMAIDGFYVLEKDTVFFESNKIFPMFNHKDYADVKSFLGPFVEGESDKKEAYAFATFIVDTLGKISDVKMHHHINKSYDKSLLKAILKTEGTWTSPVMNGKKVKVLKEIEFAYYNSENFGSSSNPMSFEHRFNIFPSDYRSKFNAAIKLMFRNDYKTALDIYNQCQHLTSDSANIALQKSTCFDVLNDVTNSNLMLEAVKKSNLKYLVKDKK